MGELPFDLRARAVGKSFVMITAYLNGAEVTSDRYPIGSRKRRCEVAASLAHDSRLWNGICALPAEIERRLEELEFQTTQKIDVRDEELEALASSAQEMAEPRQSQRGPSHATQLVDLVTGVSGLELWHDPDGNGFATIPIEEHFENWPLRTKRFRNYASRLFYDEVGKVPGSQALQDAINTVEGLALHRGAQYMTHIRLAEHEGEIYLDLADSGWRAVKISTFGWEVVARVPVKFRRTKGMQPHPIPTRGGSLARLRRFINAPDDMIFILIVAWIIGAFKPRGPYAILEVNGEQGSAKSTTCKNVRRLIDPNKADLRALPREERDLNIAGVNSWVIGIGNVSNIPPWLSDALCRISVDGGFATRELYSDTDETILDDRRPVILNGINEAIVRSDALDRVIRVCLPAISESDRRSEEFLSTEYEAERPALLGAVLDAVSCALRKKDSIKLTKLPRMADFATWVVAAEEALPWQPGAFLQAYMGNREAAHELALETSPVATVLRSWFEKRQRADWAGTATGLLKGLSDEVGDKVRDHEDWPKSGRGLSGHLRRLAPNLRQVGIDVQFGSAGRGGDKRRLVTIRTFNDPTVPTVPNDEMDGTSPSDNAPGPVPF